MFSKLFAGPAHVSTNLDMLLNKLLNECALNDVFSEFISQGLWPVTVSGNRMSV